MLSIFYSFWYGKVTLWKAYWLVGELLNVVVMLIIFNIEIYIFNNNNFLQLLPFLNFSQFHIFSKLLIFIWSVYITVGIWRSAENYRGKFIWTVLTLLVLSYRIFTIRLVFFSCSSVFPIDATSG